MTEEKIEPVFYILMRSDMDSLNPGKAMAQASHAYGALKTAIKPHIKLQKPAYLDWMNQTEQEFGVTYVLAGSVWEIQKVLNDAAKVPSDVVCGWVHDPTYPIKDGLVTHYLPVDTCAFLFGYAEDVQPLVSELELHP